MRRILVLVLVLCCSQAWAAERHVKITGTNNGSCLSGSPCRDIQQGINVASPGDTINVDSGTYFETPNITKSNILVRRLPGSSSKPIVSFGGSGGATGFNVNTGGDGVTLDGFIVDGQDHAGGFCLWLEHVTDIVVRNMEVRDCGIQGLLSTNEQRHTIENSIFLNNGTDTTFDHNLYFGGTDHVTRGNFLSGAACFNMQCYPNCTRPIIDRNTMTNSNCGFTLSVSFDTLFTNNVLYDDNTDEGGNHCLQLAWNRGSKNFNNTLINCGILARDDSRDIEIAGNIIVGRDIDIESGAASTTNAHNNLFSNPGLTGAPNYRLTAGASAALGDAICRSDVPFDIDGQVRPQDGTCDLGADEFAGTTTTTYHLALGTPPNSTTHVGEVMVYPPSFEIHDPSHTNQTAPPLGTTTVTLSLIQQPPGGVMSGMLVKPATDGLVEYTNLTFNVPGTYQLRATATLPSGVSIADSDPFVILSIATPVPTSLLFVAQPGNVLVGATMAPVVVRVRDQDGAPYVAAPVAVNLQIAANPAGGIMSGTRPKNTVGVTGEVSFTDLSIDTAGTPYTLQASIAGPITAPSSPFAVTAVPPPPGHAGARQIRAMFLAR